MGKSLKWFLKKEQLKNLLEISDNKEILSQKIKVDAFFMVWGWGASVSLVGEDGLQVTVPYYQEEAERSQEERDILNGFNHHLQHQTFFLKELLNELKIFMEKEFNVLIEIPDLD